MEATLKETRRYENDGYEDINYDILNENGDVIGWCNIMADDTAYCEGIAINKECRNKGYGTSALYELSNIYGGITVAPDNEDAKRLYERIGSESRYENADYIDQGYGVYDI